MTIDSISLTIRYRRVENFDYPLPERKKFIFFFYLNRGVIIGNI